ncbi:FAD binding domain-containing protein [Streptomonospora litoralis]|uniref:6-hydroxypseudooxynicotine dehydrogenase complex subunit alpha n=1 Tax=Streptomonospora litoralis TaxID=2498135 RepID=A0A4P6Q4M2_9ACTN|nr:FAD binding domain-containing protein [Streptomonospora litoralis]QBI55605.1 6-hydroxypseudooxynicotine dehydrogenase complex subunit alpha [Streptomonospora litoralis]
MKPPPFAYHAPTELDEAVTLLAEAGEEGKVLAGGQSLIPLLNMRLAAPGVLVDINRVAGLGGIEVDGAGVRVGALVRHSALEAHTAAAEAVPLLRQGLRLVAHPVIRNRGTSVGSIAHADPSGEMPAVLALLEGEVEVRGPAGGRTVPAAEFVTGPMDNALAGGEIAVAARFPRPGPGTGTAFVETARRHGDYALCGVAAAVALDAAGRITTARCCLISVAPVPLVVDLTAHLAGRPAEAVDLAAAAAEAADTTEPEDDIHAGADYRRHLARVLTERALAQAAARAAAATAPTPADTGASR